MTTNTRSTAAGALNQTDAFVERRISWGAILAGVALFFSLSWLLLLFGSALGVGVADATDMAAIGDGFSIGAIIWLLLTTLVAMFAGALLAAKLAGSADDSVGALHGLTLWSVSTLAVLLLGAAGVGGAINALSSVVNAGVQAGKQVIGGTPQQSNSDAQAGIGLPDAVTNTVAATLKRQAAKLLSSNAAGSDSPDQAEVRQAIDSLDSDDIGAVASALVSGNEDKARERLTNRTDLSKAEIDSVIAGAQEQMNKWQESEAVQQAQTWIEQTLTKAEQEASQSASKLAGPELDAAEVRQTLRDIDADTLASIAGHLIQGEPQRAKDVLVAQTALSDREANAIVDGAEQEVDAVVEQAKAELNETTEAVASYTQAVLWSAFVAGCIGLVAGLFGGYMGASAVRRTSTADGTAANV